MSYERERGRKFICYEPIRKGISCLLCLTTITVCPHTRVDCDGIRDDDNKKVDKCIYCQTWVACYHGYDM